MADYVNTVLKTEITFLPGLIQKYVKNYNNALCNGATWLFFVWSVVHFFFDQFINALLKKMRYKEYMRLRLKNSLWYLGFYSVIVIYCAATLITNNLELIYYRRMYDVNDFEPAPMKLTFGFVLLCTFYAHSAIYAAFQDGWGPSSFSYAFLCAFVACTYFFRHIEIAFSLTAIIGITQIIIELTKCLSTVIRDNSQVLVKICFSLSICTLVLTHFFIVFLSFVIPLANGLIWNYTSMTLLMSNLTLWGWIVSDFLNSEKRFEKDNKLRNEYKDFMAEYLKLGHMQLLGVLTHFFIVFLSFVIPLANGLIWNYTSMTLLMSNLTLWGWIVSDFLNSPVYRLSKHWIYHLNERKKQNECAGSLIECSLFLPRTDAAYNLSIIRQEIKDREAKMISLRKPKGRNMLLQTLKCMVAIKRKLNTKRKLSESSESSESERSVSDLTSNKMKNQESDSEDEAVEIEEDKCEENSKLLKSPDEAKDVLIKANAEEIGNPVENDFSEEQSVEL